MERMLCWILFLLSLMLCLLLLAQITHGFSVMVQWDANKEPDLLGYRIYHDVDSGVPYNGAGSPINVLLSQDENSDPNKFACTIKNLENPIVYIAISAYDTEGLESGLSNEVTTRCSVNARVRK